ncbi:unnamed protein product [Nesidiocoris tenuis]|uniref:Uncharacterized protein n=1 Tax=Nesidiocoris tenuis TaxID=355587 RepID=A0A6H5H0H4_9HEMI|nr:unnamed protein product [Nesidiocoris tenuis]
MFLSALIVRICKLLLYFPIHQSVSMSLNSFVINLVNDTQFSLIIMQLWYLLTILQTHIKNHTVHPSSLSFIDVNECLRCCELMRKLALAFKFQMLPILGRVCRLLQIQVQENLRPNDRIRGNRPTKPDALPRCCCACTNIAEKGVQDVRFCHEMNALAIRNSGTPWNRSAKTLLESEFRGKTERRRRPCDALHGGIRIFEITLKELFFQGPFLSAAPQVSVAGTQVLDADVCRTVSAIDGRSLLLEEEEPKSVRASLLSSEDRARGRSAPFGRAYTLPTMVTNGRSRESTSIISMRPTSSWAEVLKLNYCGNRCHRRLSNLRPDQQKALLRTKNHFLTSDPPLEGSRARPGQLRLSGKKQRLDRRISLIGVATCRYYNLTYECSAGGELVRAYLVGKLAILSLVSILLLVIMNRSAQGAICDVYSRRHVPKLIAIKSQRCFLRPTKLDEPGEGQSLHDVLALLLRLSYDHDFTLFHRHIQTHCQLDVLRAQRNDDVRHDAQETPRRESRFGQGFRDVSQLRFSFDRRTDDETTYEMRWLTPEDLLELRIMPRMLLDHFPYNLLKAIATVLEEQRTEIIDYPEITLI